MLAPKTTRGGNEKLHAACFEMAWSIGNEKQKWQPNENWTLTLKYHKSERNAWIERILRR